MTEIPNDAWVEYADHKEVAGWLSIEPHRVIRLRNRHRPGEPSWREMEKIWKRLDWDPTAQVTALSAGEYGLWLEIKLQQYAATLPAPYPCACGCGEMLRAPKWVKGHHLGWLNKQAAMARNGDMPRIRAIVSVEHPELLEPFDRIVITEHFRKRKASS